jgi:glycosyltransferase involved in cell wall biosynthesis
VNPSISVIVPVQNGAAFYTSAIATMTAQQYPHLEIIIIDDGSTDDIRHRIDTNSTAVRYHYQQQRGPASARNTGIRLATSPLIAFLDIDDLWTPGHLSRLTDALRAQPDARFAQGLMQQFIQQDAEPILTSGSYRMPYLGSCLFRRETLTHLSGFDEHMRMGEDYDFILRCWEQDIPRVCIDEVSLLYRRHSGNMTRGKNNAANLEVLQRRIQRIRSGAFDPTQPRRFPFATYIGDVTHFSTIRPQEAA